VIIHQSANTSNLHWTKSFATKLWHLSSVIKVTISKVNS